MKNLTTTVITTFCLLLSVAFANTDAPVALRSYSLQKMQAVPVIDGDWDDEVWQSLEPTGEFIQSEPVENAPPSQKTAVKIFYTDNAIYFAAYCYDSEPDKILKQLGTRDDNLNADNFRIA